MGIGKADHPPKLLERFSAQLAKIHAPIVAGIEDDEIDRIEVFAVRHGAIEQACDVAFARCIGQYGLGATSGIDDRLHGLVDLGRGAPGDENMMAFAGEAAAIRGAEPLFGADADDNGSGLFMGELHPRCDGSPWRA